MMLSRNLYRVKKAPLSKKRKKALLVSLLVFSIIIIGYGFYGFSKLKPASGQKEELKQDIGDRPLKKNQIIYINADGGLSLRADHDANSQRLTIIPNKTRLEATEELEGWFKVNYQGKEGWVAKQYVTLDQPQEDPYKDWGSYSISFKIKYPLGWKYKEYGANDGVKSSSVVAFSNQELPESLPVGSDFIAPVVIKVSTESYEDARKSYSTLSGVATEPISFGVVTGEKYTYISSYSNTQQTAIVVSGGGKVFILSEGGGYQDDLMNMIKTFSL